MAKGIGDKKEGASERSLAPALARGIKILELVAERPKGIVLTEIASEIGIAKSSAFGLCSTLLSAGLLERASDGSFRIGLRIVDLASSRLGGSDIAADFYRLVDSMEAISEQAVVLSVRNEGVDVVYVACRNSPQPLGISFKIGMRLPACCTATGKALLSTLSDTTIKSLYREHELARLTKSGVASVDALLKQLAQVRKQGYSVDDGETREHMCSFGAPVLAHDGRAVAGVAISYYRAELTAAQRKKAPELVRRLAEGLSNNPAIGENALPR